MSIFGFIRKRFSTNMTAVTSTSSYGNTGDENLAIDVGDKEKEHQERSSSVPLRAGPTFYETFHQTAESVGFSYTVNDLPSVHDCVQQIRELGPMRTKRIPIDFKSTSKSCQGHTFSLTVSEFIKSVPRVPHKSLHSSISSTSGISTSSDSTSVPGPVLEVKAKLNLKGKHKDTKEVLILSKLKLDLTGSGSESRCCVIDVDRDSELKCSLHSDDTFTKSFLLLSWKPTVKSLTFTISGRVQYKHFKPKLVQAGLSTATVSITQALTTVSMPEFVNGMLQGLLFSDVHSDILINCDGEIFPAHRSILGAASPVFSAMMTTDMKENHDNVIVMKETSASVCKELLRFLYTGSVDTTNWSMEFTQELYKNADMFDVPALKSICERKLASLINVDNVGQLYTWTGLHQLDKVRHVAKNFTMDNKTAVFKANGMEQAIHFFADILDEIMNMNIH